jgi:hypothetical protein
MPADHHAAKTCRHFPFLPLKLVSNGVWHSSVMRQCASLCLIAKGRYRMRRYLCIVLACIALGTVPAAAFQDTDLETVAQRAQAALGPGFGAEVGNRQRVVLMCARCNGPTMVTIQIGCQADGTEDRVRAGQTTMADMERQCQANEPSCRIERADMGRAVGWVSSYRGAAVSGSTLVLLRGGDMLTVRSNAPSPEIAHENMRRLQRTVVPQIVGR